MRWRWRCCSGSAENTRKRLTAGEASYRAFFDHAVEGIFRTTPEGHYLAVNQALAEIYGYATPEALMSAPHRYRRPALCRYRAGATNSAP